MKILLDCTYLRNIHTGVDEYFFGLISSILEIDTTNSYIIFIDSRYDDKKLIELIAQYKNYSIKRLYSPFPLQVLYSSFMFPFYLWLKNIDVYHNPYMFGPLFKIGKTKIIITVHDLFHRTVPQLRNKSISIVFRTFSEWAIQNADRIIVISNQTKDDVQKFLRIKDYKLVLIYQALKSNNTREFNKENIRENIRIKNKFILIVGSIIPNKGHKDLILAFHKICETYNRHNVSLICAGMSPDNYIDELKSLVSNLGLTESIVQFLGYINQDELKFLYQNCEFVVIPSHYEGFGFPVLEAMFYGKPVISRNSSSLIEVTGDAGILFNTIDELTEKLELLLSDSTLVKNLQEKGTKQLKKFSSGERALRTLDLYNKE